IAVDGHLGPINQAHLAATPFDGKLRLDQVSLSSLQKFLNSSSLTKTDAIASGEAHIKNEHPKLTSHGSLALDHARINGIDVGYPISGQYDFSDDLDNDLLTIQKGDLKLGSTPLSVTGMVNLKPTPLQLDVKVNTSDASIEG